MIVADNRVVQFAEKALGRPMVPPLTCMGIEKDGEIIAAAIFNGYTRTDISLTAVGKGWTREFLREMGRYVYGSLGCLRMTAITEQPEVVALSARLGGKVEGTLRNYFGPGRDGALIGILKEEYRYEGA